MLSIKLCLPSVFYWPVFFPLYLSTWLTVKSSGGQLHHQTDMYRKRLQQQITWVQSLLFVLLPLLVIRWQGLRFLEGEMFHCIIIPPESINALWSFCHRHRVTPMRNMPGQWTCTVCLCFMWSVWIYDVDSLLEACSRLSLSLSW